MSDLELLASDAEEQCQNTQPTSISACPDCTLGVDLILESSDGILFAAHSQKLEQFSEGFPPAVLVSDDMPVVAVPEDSTVVPLLLQYMHLKPQPDLSVLQFSVLEALSNAVEKYLIYGAMPICNIYMKFRVKNYPIQVLRYAAKHNYNALANQAAVLSIQHEFNAVKPMFEKGSLIPYFWLEYREQWVAILHSLITEEPGVILHKGGLTECESWGRFHRKVLKEVASSLTQLRQFKQAVDQIAGETLVGCSYCRDRARNWSSTVVGAVASIRPFSAFLD